MTDHARPRVLLLADSSRQIVCDVVSELLSARVGSELYRVAVDDEFVGRPFREYAVAMLEQACAVIGLARGNDNIINPEPDFEIAAKDEAFVVSREPPA